MLKKTKRPTGRRNNLESKFFLSWTGKRKGEIEGLTSPDKAPSNSKNLNFKIET
jgi:hypothetical protein